MRARRPALMSAPAKLSPGLISTLRVAAGAVGGIASGGGGDSSTGPGASGQRERRADAAREGRLAARSAATTAPRFSIGLIIARARAPPTPEMLGVSPRRPGPP